ncbi:OmpA family protein [Chitinophagaceae bacterium LB-8]|uniref:OmpA family protein n=1 Tax=Paraflavisolibacter caeni TaxID=2982496 RepID=A0A9X2XP46_9BACT|nr:OmpA family protein [Paraflavisolibacter caeni]MCU7549884.1 OmpA family protein [Paraflavisolibacter caeni]
MKKVIYFSLLNCLTFTVFCQKGSYKQASILDIHCFINNFKISQKAYHFKQFNPGIGISFISGIIKSLDLQIQLNGSFPDSSFKRSNLQKNQLFLLTNDICLRARILPENKWIQPYVSFGSGTALYNNEYQVYLPFGTGMQLNYKGMFLLLTAQYHHTLNQSFNSGFYYSLGIAGAVGKKKKLNESRNVVSMKNVPVDKDQDGIPDDQDACPSEAGTLLLSGCPDTDGDGIIDSKDKCPKKFGLVKYSGCPIPDTDNDGLNDEQDLCPELPGSVAHKGCPFPDNDLDGISNNEDSCINLSGSKENFGCPFAPRKIVEQLETAAKRITFQTGRYKLSPKSFSVLDEVAGLLLSNPVIKIKIEGHTDDKGSKEMNKILSELRAKEVLLYLKGKGIQQFRLQAIGYGEIQPLVDNSSKEGQAKNRRVELKIMYE